jgi:hypothetical protein
MWNVFKWQIIGFVVTTCEKSNELSDYSKKGNILGLRSPGILGGVVW